VLQDARSWDRAGVIDALVPMVYWGIKPSYGERLDFAYLADDHATNVQAPVFIGMSVPGMEGPALARHIERARIAGAEGVSLFSYSALENGNLWDVLPAGPFYWPAGTGR
jgi:uncharacterized lipoprotein YddW (UPF0748 family)